MEGKYAKHFLVSHMDGSAAHCSRYARRLSDA